ncbi:hypothetical protein RJG79_07850 [Mycoplasmatota bacterium WC44]
MAELKLGTGTRWSKLADLIVKHNKNIKKEELEHSIIVKGPYISITRDMIEDACFPKGVRNKGAITRVIDGLALLRIGRLIHHSDKKIVIGDDDGERALTFRLRVDQQETITNLAKELGISRNQFIINATEYYINYLEESRSLFNLEQD